MPVELEIACAKQQTDLLPLRILRKTQALPTITFSILLCLSLMSQGFALADPGRPVVSSNWSPVKLGESARAQLPED